MVVISNLEFTPFCRQTKQFWLVCIKLFPKYPRHVYVHKKRESKEVCYYHMAGSTVVVGAPMTILLACTALSAQLE